MVRFIFLALVSLLFISCSSDKPDVKLVVLSTTDIHGHLYGWNYNTDQPDPAHSLLQAATIIERIESQNEHTLLLDAGDWFQGNSFADFFAGIEPELPNPQVQLFELMNYDAVVLGNHEFNFGIETLNYQLDMVDVPFLGANITDYHTGEPAYTPYIIKDIGSFNVAVIGLTTPGSAIWDRPRVEGRLNFEDGVETAAYYVQKVEEEGADVVIILAHSGFEGATSYASDTLGEENFGKLIAEQVPGVHALILGHTHRIIEDRVFVTDANPYGVTVTQPGRWASHIGRTELYLTRRADGSAFVGFGTNEVIPVSDEIPQPELFEQFSYAHEMVREYINEPLATTSSVWEAADARLVDRPIIDLIHRVQMEATGAQLSAAAIFNPSASFGPGGITRGDVAAIYPYANTLFKLGINGSDLREFLEFSMRYYATTPIGEFPESAGVTPGFNLDFVAGVNYDIDLSQPVGNRILNLTYDGLPVQDNQEFTIAVNSYRTAGGGDFEMITRAEVITEIDTSVRVLIEEFLIEKGQIEPSDIFMPNWRILGL